jgi:hypothetical protein
MILDQNIKSHITLRSHNLTMVGAFSSRWLLLCLLLKLRDERSTCSALQLPSKETQSVSRRRLLSGTAFSLASLPFIPSANAVPEPSPMVPLKPGGAANFNPVIQGEWELPALTTKLAQSRIQATQLSPLRQMPWEAKELYYAPFLFGAWNVTATLKRKGFPYGPEYLPSRSLLEGSPRNRNEKVGSTTSYQVHYFSTLPDTLANQVTVNLGLGVPKSTVIQDRAFNAVSISAAYQQLVTVQDVEWDYSKDPEKVVLTFGAGPLAEDMRPLGKRRTEVFLTVRQTDSGSDDSDSFDDSGNSNNKYNSGNSYTTAEQKRSVAFSPGNVVVSDTETITDFFRVSDDHIKAVSRIAVYLSPNPNSREGVMWQQVGGKAVAFYDYEVVMVRQKEGFVLRDGSKQERACVQTPKDVVQCE